MNGDASTAIIDPTTTYWGGYTEHGEALHLVTGSTLLGPVAACGRPLAQAWAFPPAMVRESYRCASCRRGENGSDRA